MSKMTMSSCSVYALRSFSRPPCLSLVTRSLTEA